MGAPLSDAAEPASLGGDIFGDSIFGDGVFRHLDATLGVAGLPQSATGQTTLLTGDNAALRMGRHYGPWPGPTLKRYLDRGSLFSEVGAAHGCFANVYPPGYFAALRSGKQKVNVPVYAAQAAGWRLRDLEDYRRERALAADLTGRFFYDHDPSLPLYRPERAGAILAGLARDHTLTFFDFWQSDSVGHRGSYDDALELVARLDAFLAGLLGARGDITLLVTSDHGNLEDKTHKRHTRNRVPLIVLGPGAAAFAEATRIEDVAPAIRRVLFGAEDAA